MGQVSKWDGTSFDYNKCKKYKYIENLCILGETSPEYVQECSTVKLAKNPKSDTFSWHAVYTVHIKMCVVFPSLKLIVNMSFLKRYLQITRGSGTSSRETDVSDYKTMVTHVYAKPFIYTSYKKFELEIP